MTGNRIPVFESGQALNSFRESDFDLPSAIGELVDNSIESNARNIKIFIEDYNLGKKHLIKRIFCGDDGNGMDGAIDGVLHNCIRLGYSSRYDNRKGIGRFGVGMTFAGIRFASKIEVYSKTKDNDWNYIKFDLKDKADVQGILSPIKKDPLKFNSLVGDNSGTLVVWSDFDRVELPDLNPKYYYDDFDDKHTLNPYGQLNHWLGRTYRKFIWRGIKIHLNGREVNSFDPLYLNKDKNQFPNDSTATIKIPPKKILWHIPKKFRRDPDIEESSDITITMTLLPEEYRPKEGSGSKHFNKGRYIYENEGISILRADREVFYGIIPYFYNERGNLFPQEPLNRWWGCEICFEPVLDESFTVKNIKRGAIPTPELKHAIYEYLIATRNDCVTEVREKWEEIRHTQSRITTTDNGVKPEDSPHFPATTVATQVEEELPSDTSTAIGPTQEQRTNYIEELIKDLADVDKSKYRAIFSTNDFSIVEKQWKGDLFIDIRTEGGITSLEYNNRHPFFQKLFILRRNLESINDEDKSLDIARELNITIDLLLMAFVRARKRYLDDSNKYTVDKIIDFLLSDWGRFLTAYIEKERECLGEKVDK